MKLLSIATLILILCAAATFAAAQQPARVKTVKIYLLKSTAAGTSEHFEPVTRQVAADAPLRLTLESLFAPQITEDEKRRGFFSATSEMVFEGVELKNGTATIKFSQPPEATNYGSLGADYLTLAIEKTAKQFPASSAW